MCTSCLSVHKEHVCLNTHVGSTCVQFACLCVHVCVCATTEWIQAGWTKAYPKEGSKVTCTPASPTEHDLNVYRFSNSNAPNQQSLISNHFLHGG